MHIVQRSLLLFVSVIFFVFGVVLLCSKKEEKLQKQWENVQTERFLKKLCRTGSCSLEDYRQFHGILNYSGNDAEIRIEEYKKEQDMKRQTYYYLIAWEEVRDSMLEKGVYKFEEGSVLCIEVKQKGRMQSRISRQFSIISGRE